MAARQRKAGSSGRVTPKAGPKTGAAKPANAPPPKGRARVDPDAPVSIGRRPSSARFLVIVGLMWIAVGALVFLNLRAGWKLIPAIFAVGVGLMFLRGAGATVIRRERRRKTEN